MLLQSGLQRSPYENQQENFLLSGQEETEASRDGFYRGGVEEPIFVIWHVGGGGRWTIKSTFIWNVFQNAILINNSIAYWCIFIQKRLLIMIIRSSETNILKILIIDNFFFCQLIATKFCTVIELGNISETEVEIFVTITVSMATV